MNHFYSLYTACTEIFYKEIIKEFLEHVIMIFTKTTGAK